MPISTQAVADSLLASIKASAHKPTPYPNWYMTDCIPDDAVDTILNLPLEAPSLDGVSGKRELHNATRTYFDEGNMERFPVCKAFNEAFQSKRVTDTIEQHFNTSLKGTYLRVEYAQDTNNFWLEPHTDLGVKTFTMFALVLALMFLIFYIFKTKTLLQLI